MPSPHLRRTAAAKEDEELGSPTLTASINGPVAATDAKLLKEIRGRQLTFDLPELGECAGTGHGAVGGRFHHHRGALSYSSNSGAGERPTHGRPLSLERDSPFHDLQHA